MFALGTSHGFHADPMHIKVTIHPVPVPLAAPGSPESGLILLARLISLAALTLAMVQNKMQSFGPSSWSVIYCPHPQDKLHTADEVTGGAEGGGRVYVRGDRERLGVIGNTNQRVASGCSTLSVRNGAPLRPPTSRPSRLNSINLHSLAQSDSASKGPVLCSTQHQALQW